MKSILLHFVTSQHYSLIGDWSMTNQWSCCFSSVPQSTILTITVEESGDDPCIDVKLGQELDDDLPSVGPISDQDNRTGRQHHTCEDRSRRKVGNKIVNDLRLMIPNFRAK